VAEELDGEVVGAGQVRFGFAGKGLWAILDELRAGSLDRTGVVPIEPSKRLARQGGSNSLRAFYRPAQRALPVPGSCGRSVIRVRLWSPSGLALSARNRGTDDAEPCRPPPRSGNSSPFDEGIFDRAVMAAFKAL
jgi:hypothetical protein